jgi:virulence-associated protein VapD
MLTNEELDYTVTTFVNVVRANKSRLRTSLRNRERAHEDLEKGLANERIEWVRESVMVMMDTLEEIARKFNEKHPNDLCSVDDFKDILMSTLRTFAQFSK